MSGHVRMMEIIHGNQGGGAEEEEEEEEGRKRRRKGYTVFQKSNTHPKQHILIRYMPRTCTHTHAQHTLCHVCAYVWVWRHVECTTCFH